MLFDSPFVSLPVNDRGRDFCIGDLHGCRQMLDQLLMAVDFDPQRDRLFSVGDLIHRGPESAACLCLAEQPWFFPVMGNHEAMQIAAYAGAYWVEDSKLETGLEYLADADPQAIAREHQRYQAILDGLPLAIETILMDGRRVGIVHAGLRSPYLWADVQAIYRRDAELDRPRVALQPLLLWDRLPTDFVFTAALPDAKTRIAALNLAQRRQQYVFGQQIPDIDLLISGHSQTPGDQPLRAGMRLFMDTGAGLLDGWLSMVELATGRCWQVPDPRMFPDMPVRILDRYLEPVMDLPWLPESEMPSLAEELQRAWSRLFLHPTKISRQPMLFDTPFVSLPVNKRGRDFCIGDLHGCREMLGRLMDAVAFDQVRDRLFSVGDLVHRGPESVRCLRLAETPWFFAVMGNHEAMQQGAYYGAIHSSGRSVSSQCEYDGMDDPLWPGKPEQARMEGILQRLPLAMEIPLRDGRRVGILHAGLPAEWTWENVRAISNREEFLFEKLRPGLQPAILWDRQPIIAATAAVYHTEESELRALYPTMRRYQFSQVTKPAVGLDLLVSGHTTLKKWPLAIGNRQYIDRGAGKVDGSLLMVKLGTEHYWEVPDPRHDPSMPVSEHTGFTRARHDLPWLTPEELATMERTGRPPVDPNVLLFYPGLQDDNF